MHDIICAGYIDMNHLGLKGLCWFAIIDGSFTGFYDCSFSRRKGCHAFSIVLPLSPYLSS